MKRASANFVLSFLVCLFAFAATAQAGGFGLFEWGNAALGQGTAFYATGDDPSVVAYNPAQMTRLEGTQVYAGVTAISPAAKVHVDGSEHAIKNQIFMVPHAYVTHQVNDKLFLGFGEFTRFGLGTKYDDYWAGSSLIREVDLKSFSFNPTLAYKVTDDFSIAAGLEIIKGSMFLTRATVPGGPSININVEGTALAPNLGLLYDVTDDVSIGFSYRAPVSFSGSGEAEVDNLPFKDRATVEAVFPSQYSLGLGYTPIDGLSFEFDVLYTRWSLFDVMEYDFGVLPDTTEVFNYKNTWRFQLGAEYMATDDIALRAGYVFDQTPTQHAYASPMLPANDRNMFTLGVGYKLDDLTFDLAGMYIITKERNAMTKDGQRLHFREGRTWGLGASIGYQF